MKWLAEERPKTPGGREAWAEAPLLALPSPEIDPLEGQKFEARLMLAGVDFVGRWVATRSLGLTEVAQLLVDWTEGPEEALMKWWGQEAPRGGRGPAPVVVVSAPEGANAQDLDL